MPGLSLDFISQVADLNEKSALEIAKRRLADGEEPLVLVNECRQGMRIVGERYGEGRYFIAGLIMAGEILRQVTELVGPAIQAGDFDNRRYGKVVLGTVKEDIHDLGKNIVKMLLNCNGFEVFDLGVDVSPDKFVEETTRIKPDIVGLSGLITASYKSMQKTIVLLKQETEKWPKQPHVIIGGSQIDETVSHIVGTDYWVTEADEGVSLCKRLVVGQL